MVNLKNKKGITILEILVSLIIISIGISISINISSSISQNIKTKNALREIKQLIRQTRYKSMKSGCKHKIYALGNNLILEKEEKEKWVMKDKITFPDFSLKSSAKSVFFPEGNIIPLNSIYLYNKIYTYKITISIAGRIKSIKVN